MKKYILVGCSGRALGMFTKPLEERFSERARLVSGHGGGNECLLRMLFVGDLPDPLDMMADSHAGNMSILAGITANKSLFSGKFIKVTEFLSRQR